MDKNLAGESGFLNLYTLAVALIAICAVGAAVHAGARAESDFRAFRPPQLTPAPAAIFPTQVVNQAKVVEPMPEIYY